MRDVRVAAVQMFSRPCRPAENLDRMESLVRRAARRKADIVCFPEMAVCGFDYGQKLRPVYDASERVPDGPSTQRLLAMARRYRVLILAGISEKGDGEFRYNTCVLAGPEGYAGKYRKVHMNSERWLYFEASDFPVFDTPHGRIGISICYDNTFCECARILAVQGAEILFAPNCADTVSRRKANGTPHAQLRRWHESGLMMRMLRARALDNNMFVVFSNMFGGPHRYIGGACILDPRGDFLARCGDWKEDLAVADLRAGQLVECRASLTCTLKRRRPPLYGALSAPPRG